MKNKSWVYQICNKYFYGWNNIKETFHIDRYPPISDIQLYKKYFCGHLFPDQYFDLKEYRGTTDLSEQPRSEERRVA